MGEEAAIDQRLAAFVEIEEVGRLRIDRRTEGPPGLRGQVGRIAAFQPWREATQQAAQRFQVRIAGAFGGVAGGALHRHGALQRSGCQMGEHRTGQSTRHGGPIGAVVFGLRSGRQGRGGRHPQPCGRLQEAAPSGHTAAASERSAAAGPSPAGR